MPFRPILSNVHVYLSCSLDFIISRAGYHQVLGFRFSVCCRLVAVCGMANMQSFCFIIACHNFATLENRLTYQCPSSWPVVITVKKKLAGTLKYIQDFVRSKLWQQVCNRLDPKKSGKSCEGRNFSWLSSKVSRTMNSKLSNFFPKNLCHYLRTGEQREPYAQSLPHPISYQKVPP